MRANLLASGKLKIGRGGCAAKPTHRPHVSELADGREASRIDEGVGDERNIAASPAESSVGDECDVAVQTAARLSGTSRCRFHRHVTAIRRVVPAVEVTAGSAGGAGKAAR